MSGDLHTAQAKILEQLTRIAEQGEQLHRMFEAQQAAAEEHDKAVAEERAALDKARAEQAARQEHLLDLQRREVEAVERIAAVLERGRA